MGESHKVQGTTQKFSGTKSPANELIWKIHFTSQAVSNEAREPRNLRFLWHLFWKKMYINNVSYWRHGSGLPVVINMDTIRCRRFKNNSYCCDVSQWLLPRSRRCWRCLHAQTTMIIVMATTTTPTDTPSAVNNASSRDEEATPTSLAATPVSAVAMLACRSRGSRVVLCMTSPTPAWRHHNNDIDDDDDDSNNCPK